MRAVLGLGLCGLMGCSGLIADAEPSYEVEAGAVIEASDPRFCEIAGKDPGRVTIRRLNRLEYNNTVRDLLGDTSQPADAFPRDDESGDGFDNNGDVLTLSPLLIEKYDAAARALAPEALRDGGQARTRYLQCDLAQAGLDGCVDGFIREFGLRAWRRPLEDGEVAQLVTIAEQGRSEGLTDSEALEHTVRAMLLSPNFLLRAETTVADADPAPLDGFELASRLSYFLWSSMPDEELLALAAEGSLNDRTAIRAQVDRMLQDEKGAAFYESFAGQWLHVRLLEEAAPDAAQFPAFDDQLRQDMATETLLFVRHVVENDLPISTLLSANFTFLNERLAAHYQIDGVTGDEFRITEVDPGTRGGLLTQGSILTVTSHPTETSPVKRGKWVLDQLLCTEVPDPPADVDTFQEVEGPAETTRERLERHRADPACAGCHNLMDPIGLGLENYDAVGAWRTEDGDEAVDPAGVLSDGRSFSGAQELSELLRGDEAYARCATEKLLSFALGRAVRAEDRCFVEDILEQAASRDLSLRGLITEIVTNDVFGTVGAGEGGS